MQMRRAERPDTGMSPKPGNLDLFHAHLLNSPAAAVEVMDSLEAQANRAINDMLAKHFNEDQIGLLFKRRERFLGTIDNPKSVGEFAAHTKAVLDAALARASELD